MKPAKNPVGHPTDYTPEKAAPNVPRLDVMNDVWACGDEQSLGLGRSPAEAWADYSEIVQMRQKIADN